jgi:hypothetical protein
MVEAQRKNAVASEDDFPQCTPYQYFGLARARLQILIPHGFPRKQPSPTGVSSGVLGYMGARFSTRRAGRTVEVTVEWS